MSESLSVSRTQFVEAGWRYLHAIADGSVCSDGSCHRCRTARVVLEAENAKQPQEEKDA